MVHEISLKEIERKAFTSTFQDGMLDMYLGLFLVAMGVSPNLEKIIPTSDLWIAILMIPIMPLWWVGKKCVTIPRMGLVTFGSTRKAKLKKTRIVRTGNKTLLPIGVHSLGKVLQIVQT